jgi:hypothetical protein
MVEKAQTPEFVVGTHDATLTLRQRLQRIMADVGYIQKKGHMKTEKQEWSFVRHDDVTAALRPLFVKYGILAISTVKDHKHDGNLTTLFVSTTLMNVDDAADTIVVENVGYGVDSQDKGPGKAMSYATKYAYLKVFALETGDDPENESVEAETTAQATARTATPEAAAQNPGLKRFWTAARNTKLTEEQVHAWVQRNLSLESTKDMSEVDLQHALAWVAKLPDAQKALLIEMKAGALTDAEALAEARRRFNVESILVLTLKEWAELVDWAKGAADADIPFGNAPWAEPKTEEGAE